MENNIKKSYESKVIGVDDKGIVVFAANAFNNEDAAHDISLNGSFQNTIKNDFARLKWFMNHDQTKLLGVVTNIEETPSYLQTTGQLNMKKQISLDILSDYQLYAENDKTLEHSILVQALNRDKQDPRKVIEWKLWEVSTLTNWGCNMDTPLLDLKSMTPNQAKDHLELLLKGLETKRYTGERQKTMEKGIDLIKKALNGTMMVQCPSCGLIFDYNGVEEHTLESEITENVARYTRWLADGIAYEEVQKLEPAIREQVQAIISSKKSIEDVTSYVRCPKCYGRINRAHKLIEEEPIEDAEEKGISEYNIINLITK